MIHMHTMRRCLVYSRSCVTTITTNVRPFSSPPKGDSHPHGTDLNHLPAGPAHHCRVVRLCGFARSGHAHKWDPATRGPVCLASPTWRAVLELIRAVPWRGPELCPLALQGIPPEGGPHVFQPSRCSPKAACAPTPSADGVSMSRGGHWASVLVGVSALGILVGGRIQAGSQLRSRGAPGRQS